MSAHRAVRTRRHAFRRTVTAVVLATTAGLGLIAAAGPAQAATTWFVKPALSGGNNAAACTSSATACATISGVLAKATFANGDTINVAAGTYIDRPVFGTKGATVNGAGAGSTIITNNNQANTSTIAVTGAITVNLNDLQVTGGNNAASPWGGGIRVGSSANPAAVVNATNVTVTGNKSVIGAGVLVYTNASFTATNSTISSNVSSGTNSAGGGIYSIGTVTLSGGSVTGNTAPLGGGMALGGTTTITNTTISNNTGSTQGGGVYNNGPTQLTGATFSGNSSPLGAGLYNAGNIATFGNASANSGGTLQNNNATNAGGGLWVAAGTANLNNATVQNNTATNGGAAFGNAATLNLTGTTASGNTSLLGGALYNTGTATLNSSTLSGNTGLQGGAAYSTGTLNLTSSTVSGNNTTGAVASQQAGGIVASGPTTLTNSTVSNNTTGNQGGGIVTSGALTMNGTNVTGNTAVLGGGLVTAGTTNVTGGSINNNTAVNGGALYNTGTATYDGTQLNGNTANGGTTTNGGNAGAIYNANALTLHQTTMSGNKVVANTNATPGITGYGGGILQVTLSATITPTLTLQNANISGGGVSGGNAVIGGGIAVYPNTISGGTTGKISGSALIFQNVAQAGGGIFTPGQLTLTNATVEGNKATHASAGNGGGIYAGGSPIVLDHTSVSSNDATVAGGGMFVLAGSTTELKNSSSVGGNTAVSGAGILNASTLTMSDSIVNGNDASYAGGGLYSTGASNLTNVNFDTNSAAGFGGSILTATGALTMTKGQVNNSDAFAGGGVIVGANSAASFDGVRFSDNTSTGANSGGGALLSAGNVSVKNSYFLNNTADGASGYGGAIFSGSQDDNVNTSLQVDTSLFTGNSAYGASAIVAGSNGNNSTNKTAINNSTITGNSSASAIGALQLYQGTSITGSTITDNTAGGAANQNVGGIVAAAGVVSLSGSILSGNTGHQCYQAVADGGYNLINPNDANCGLSGAKHDVVADPQLAALADNGGPTQTRMPSAASPALDQIPASTATGVNDGISGNAITLCGAGAIDQRGTSRPQGSKCDIGAVEKAQVAPTVDGPANADYAVGNAGTPLTYTSTGSPQPTLSATGLPTGVTFHDNGDGTGTISGTPAAGTGGSYDVVVTATNEAGSASKHLTLVVHQAPLFSGPATDTYTVGQPGSTTFTQTSGHPLGTFTSTGSLPSGVGFDGSVPGTGKYSGTPAAGTGGVYNLTVTDSNGTPPDATAAFKLTVNEASSIDGPSTATFKVGTAGASGEFTAGGFPVPTFSGTGLPAGLSVVSTGAGKAKISGTAANGTGGQYGVDVTASNGIGSPATKHVDVTVNEAPELTGPDTARFVVGVATSVGFSSDGYPQASLSESGSLPATLSFHDNGNGSATLSGTVTTADIGTYPITIKASNGVDPDATKQVTVEVVPPLSITTTSLPNAAYKTTYSAQVAATGGQPPYTFTVVGSLPAGLTMNSAGLITGATTANPGTYTFTVKATDALNPAQSSTKQLSITVVKGATVLKTAPILLTVSSNGDIKLNIALLEADLKGGYPLQPIAGAPVTFKSGGSTVCTANTDANGHVKCQPSLLNSLLVPLNGSVTATYPGNATWLGSTSSAGLVGG